jgi:hypothetical protein
MGKAPVSFGVRSLLSSPAKSVTPVNNVKEVTAEIELQPRRHVPATGPATEEPILIIQRCNYIVVIKMVRSAAG